MDKGPSARFTTFALALISTSCTITVAAPAQAQVDFEGKRIVWIVPTREGGGSDTLTRAMQPFFTKHLPGNPHIVVRNIPGSGQVPGTNHFFQNAKPDGLTLITSSTSTLLNQALGNKAVKYDMAKAESIMSIPQGSFAYASPEITGATEPGDVESLIRSGKTFRFGGYGPTSSDMRLLLCFNQLGIKIDPLWGMSRSKTRQAYMRGETDINYDTASVYLKNVLPMVRKKRATMLFSLGVQREDGTFVRDPVAPKLPHYLEIYEKVHGRKLSGPAYDVWYALFNIGVMTSKSISLPPNTPKPIVEAYVTAARNIFNDPDFQKTRKKLMGLYDVSFGKAADKWVGNSVRITPETRKWLAEYLKTNYDVDLDTAKIGG